MNNFHNTPDMTNKYDPPYSEYTKYDGLMLDADMVRDLWLQSENAPLRDVLIACIEFMEDIGKDNPGEIDYDREAVASLLRCLLDDQLKILRKAAE